MQQIEVVTHWLNGRPCCCDAKLPRPSLPQATSPTVPMMDSRSADDLQVCGCSRFAVQEEERGGGCRGRQIVVRCARLCRADGVRGSRIVENLNAR